jgi:hypothetical protein
MSIYNYPNHYFNTTLNLIKSFKFPIFHAFLTLIDIIFTLRASRSHYKVFVVARVRLGRLAVVHYSFVGHYLAFVAISAREQALASRGS